MGICVLTSGQKTTLSSFRVRDHITLSICPGFLSKHRDAGPFELSGAGDKLQTAFTRSEIDSISIELRAKTALSSFWGSGEWLQAGQIFVLRPHFKNLCIQFCGSDSIYNFTCFKNFADFAFCSKNFTKFSILFKEFHEFPIFIKEFHEFLLSSKNFKIF